MPASCSSTGDGGLLVGGDLLGDGFLEDLLGGVELVLALVDRGDVVWKPGSRMAIS